MSAEHILACGGCGPDVTREELGSALRAMAKPLIERHVPWEPKFTGAMLLADLHVTKEEINSYKRNPGSSEITRDASSGEWWTKRGTPISPRINDFVLMLRTDDGDPVFIRHSSLINAALDLFDRTTEITDGVFCTPKVVTRAAPIDGKVLYALRSESLHAAVFRPDVAPEILDGEILEGTAPLRAGMAKRQLPAVVGDPAETVATMAIADPLSTQEFFQATMLATFDQDGDQSPQNVPSETGSDMAETEAGGPPDRRNLLLNQHVRRTRPGSTPGTEPAKNA